MKKRIVQIIPAIGWHAQYKGHEGRKELSAVVCFALVEITERDGSVTQDIEPMDADDSGLIDFSRDAENFAGIVQESDPDYSMWRDNPGPWI